jgi:hypothetical protein
LHEENNISCILLRKEGEEVKFFSPHIYSAKPIDIKQPLKDLAIVFGTSIACTVALLFTHLLIELLQHEQVNQV